MEYRPEITQKAQEHIRIHGLAPTHRRIVDIVGNNRVVLDVGCAWGYLAEALRVNGCRVTGIEKDAAAAEQAREFCENIVIGDADDPDVLREAGKDFGVIICADVLEHLVDPWTTLKSLKNLLASNGELIVSIPNIAYWQMRLHLLIGRFDYTDTGLLDRTHLRFFTVDTFHRLLSECGLTVTDRIINDAGLPGFPLPKDWDRLPSWVKRMVIWFPNLCVFHAIYRLKPERGS